jgi:hypothetical protein
MTSSAVATQRTNSAAPIGPSIAGPARSQMGALPPKVHAAPAHAGNNLSGVPARTRALGEFPHRQALESAFQRPIPGSAVVDSEGCEGRGATAFTDRSTTHFASEAPPLRVAAHEAAHLMQHSGESRDANLGPERHAESVARSVESREPVAHLFAAPGARVEPRVRNYTEVDVTSQKPDEWDAKKPLRVADDGQMALGEDANWNHDLWAETGLVGKANSALATKKSVIRLKTDAGTLKGKAPGDGSARTLNKVVPENQSNGTSGDSMQIWADCGKCGRDVIGAGEGTGGGRTTADYKKVNRPWYTQIPLLGPLLGLIFGGAKTEEKQTAASEPDDMKYEIYNDKLGGTGDEGFKKYQALSPAEKEKFDRETGINKFATPKAGEGFTMSSGGADIAPPGSFTWNFHWAGVVMDSGDDRVTLENYNYIDPASNPLQNAEWTYQMYGPAGKTGQTFYEQHKASKQHGDEPTALRVEKSNP